MKSKIASICFSLISITSFAQNHSAPELSDSEILKIIEGNYLYLNEEFNRKSTSGTQELDSVIEQKYSTGTNAWEDHLRMRYRYDNSGNTIFSELSLKQGSKWMGISRVYILRDPSGKPIQDSLAAWNASLNQWDPLYKYSRIYNSNQAIAQVTKEEWQRNVTSWQNAERKSYTYAGNNLTQLDIEVWNRATSTWENDQRETFSYNSGNQLMSMANLEWDASQQSWEPVEKVDFSYNQNNISEELFSIWKTQQNRYQQLSKKQFHYSTNGKVDSIDLQTYDTTLTQWEILRKEKFVYNQDGDLSHHEHWMKNLSTGKFKIFNKTTATYNTSFAISDLIFGGIGIYRIYHSLMANQVNHMITEEVREEASHTGGNISWTFTQKWKYFYSPQTISLPEDEVVKLLMFPNPAKDFLHLDFDGKSFHNLQIINAKGATVLERTVSDKPIIDIAHLAPGSYIVQLSGKHTSVSKTLLIDR